ncbi:elongation factor P [Weissella soli]|jgi:elongation factor P|uniref:Elongation factor P n=1 Tax=Weissella soli TaxID=155866 RepID=A0A288Q6T6_9LACO|nr:elongation factor P [Weissella soli]AOT56869.1 Elongation factor [Weissella soli]MCT8395523.1 elongation factor P [Weissella soli]NKY83320.1 elongation factor P [Weissella soli]QEA34235.1 elongation factor P [Weissella soli]RDL05388.1 elongation factor P [Weissella soli]
MSIGMNDIKNGMHIEYNNGIWKVLDFQHVKPGKGGAFMRSKLKNLRNGAVNEYTFRPGDKFEEADIQTSEMQYSYADGDSRVFMNMETYDQVAIPVDKIEDAMKFLLEGTEVKVTYYGNELLGVEVPKTVELTVTETQPGIKGATANGGGKPATMETGLVITVPDFVNQGDKLVVNTDNGGTYSARA